MNKIDIPTGWSLKKLGNLATITRGASPRPIHDPIWFDDNSNIGWLRISDLTKSDKYLFETVQKLSSKGVSHSRFVENNSLILSICATVGQPIISKIDTCIHDGFVVFYNLSSDIEFIYYVLTYIRGEWFKSGQTGSQMNLNTSIINNFTFLLPPLTEQKKIAQALTDADNYISALEKLIEKKKMIKEGLMVRFFKPQLSWQESTLGDIADIVRGASPRPIESPIWFDDSSSIGWVRISDLAGQNRYLSNTQQKLSNLGIAHSRFVPKDSLIMSICATLGKPIVNKINVCIHDGFVVFNNLKINQTFLFYFLKFIEPIWKKQGQTGSQMNLNTDLIKKTHIHLPPNDVQIEYATILTNLDEEIEILESKHIKACQIKEGMMQKLLTGEIRLA